MMFRNLYAGTASLLIREATERTYEEWNLRYGSLPAERLRTEIGIKEVRSGDPGKCYRLAGWIDDRVVRGKLYMWAPNVEHGAAGGESTTIPTHDTALRFIYDERSKLNTKKRLDGLSADESRLLRDLEECIDVLQLREVEREGAVGGEAKETGK